MLCPGVIECAVIGVDDDKSGQAVKLFVVSRDPDLTADAVKQFCRESLAAYKVPKRIGFRDELPKSNVGKIPCANCANMQSIKKTRTRR